LKGLGESVDKGNLPYVAKKNTETTCRNVKEKYLEGQGFRKDLGISIKK
jgi:hypothetical protein